MRNSRRIGAFLRAGWVSLTLAAALTTALGPAAHAADPAPSPVLSFDVPRLEHITIDGDPADWADRGFRVDRLADATLGHKSPDFEASFRLGWNDQGLLVLLTVHDPTHTESDQPLDLLDRDCVQLFLGQSPPAKNEFRLVLSPGLDPKHPELRQFFFDSRRDDLRAQDVFATAARKPTSDGYVMEILLPFSDLGLTPKPNDEISLRVAINDSNDPRQPAQLVWSAGGENSYRLRLADKPSPAVTASAVAEYEHFRRARIVVNGIATPPGAALELHAPGELLRFETHAPGPYTAEFLLPLDGRDSRLLPGSPPAASRPDSPPSETPSPLTLLVNDHPTATIVLPDLAEARREAIDESRILFSPFVFASTVFPACDFENPQLMEDLVGRYRIQTTFYNAKFHEVTSADHPGRYGAIIDVFPASGPSFRRYQTLYRMPSAANVRYGYPARFSLQLPRGFGIADESLCRQTGELQNVLNRELDENLSHDQLLPILLAGAAEASKDGPSLPRRASAYETDRQWWYQLRKRIGDTTGYKYLLTLPPGYDKDSSQRWPLVVFLHGSGERGSDLNKVKSWGPPRRVAHGDTFPFILLAPQCPQGEHWLPAELMDLVDKISADYRVDPDRVYLTGLSMGGFGTWAAAIDYPDRFAAIVPICGGGDPADAPRLKSIPALVFHGQKDRTVPLRLSQEMVDALRKAGGDVRFTSYANADHNAWTPAYNDPALYQWLLAQRRHGAEASKARQ